MICNKPASFFLRLQLIAISLLMGLGPYGGAADDFGDIIAPIVSEHCVSCHGKDKTKGKLDLFKLEQKDQWLAEPELIRDVIDAVDAYDMPPDSEPEMADADREALLGALGGLLTTAVSTSEKTDRLPVQRLNRFQYSNAIRDLFQLNRDPFHLPERLMTRKTNYLNPMVTELPDVVEVSCDSLSLTGGMEKVDPFPKDLAAEHGYDNQADHLTLPPILLDAMFDLAVSILNSPDFNDKTVGAWQQYFVEPESTGDQLHSEIENRVSHFSRLAFRGPVDSHTIQRYVDYIKARVAGKGFTNAMKDGFAAILSSPKFLFRVWEATDDTQLAAYAAVSKLSFSLWGSCPDDRLLSLAESGAILDETTYRETVASMLRDPRVARFLDSFPSQWLQLETILAAAPDEKRNRYYYLEKSKHAGTQMVLEPLLLFDSIFIENRPVAELLDPSYTWQNEFLTEWYRSKLEPESVDDELVEKTNQAGFASRKKIHEEINRLTDQIDNQPDEKRLQPIAEWKFDGDLTDSIGELDLEARGKVSFASGEVTLNAGFLESPRLNTTLSERTLEIWLRAPEDKQAKGGLIAVSNKSWSIREVISWGTSAPGLWGIESNDIKWKSAPNLNEVVTPSELTQLVLTRNAKGTFKIYKNGQLYFGPYQSRKRDLPQDTQLSIGRLSTRETETNQFPLTVAHAAFYSHALNIDEVRALYRHQQNETSTKANGGDIEALLAKREEKFQQLEAIPGPESASELRKKAQAEFGKDLRNKMNSRFKRVKLDDSKYGGIITNGAVLTMTSAPLHTQPITRGTWLIDVVFNDPPPPPPNNVPALDDSVGDKSLTIRERFAIHRDNPDCSACHARLDPLGFALENYDVVGRWRDVYENNREVDASGTLLKKYQFDDIYAFKQSLLSEKARFAKAFTSHFARFFAGRELNASDVLEVERIIKKTESDDYPIRDLLLEVCSSPQLR